MPDKLSRVNLNILQYIRKNGPVPMKTCLARFGEDARPRISALFDERYIENECRPDVPHALGLVATTKGRNALQDARWTTYEHVRDSVLIPVFVSFVTALVAPDVWSFTKSLVLPFLGQLL